MSTTNHPTRRWKVRLADGRAITLACRKVHVTPNGELMVFSAADPAPSAVWAPGAWLEIRRERTALAELHDGLRSELGGQNASDA
jgi:hypothetical protein